jgi:alpha-L-fucosidase
MKRRHELSRRSALRLLAAGVPALAASRLTPQTSSIPAIQSGPFTGTRASLESYRVPEWFRDAKFGIWAHWGPQSAAEAGDWYARNIYIQDSRQYKYHLEHYGHPSKVGFKDVIPTWKAARFDPAALMQLYKNAGAKYFVSMGVHHDNFDLWNSKHTRWNAVNMGPKKDIVGLWRNEARKQGLRFGVSEHLWISYKWFAVSHLTDKTGALAGVPYDGTLKEYADLYHDSHGLPEKFEWDDTLIPESWKLQWFNRIKDVVDNYQPDLLYTDGAMPFEEYGMNLVAHHYNASAKRHGGQTEAVYNSKRREDCAIGTCVLDLERGIVDKIWPDPWQTDTCVGHWHYERGIQYKTPKIVIDMLVDIVSRNGNLLLNFPLPNNGELDAEEQKILSEITAWMAVNGEGIYATRPWKIYGQGVATTVAGENAGSFNERNRRDLSAGDLRFTSKGSTVYAFCMGWPERQAVIAPLALAGAQSVGKITNVELLGHKGKLQWTQDAAALTVQLPLEKPCEHAVTFKVTGA